MNEISIFVLLHNTTLCNDGPVHNTRLDNTYGFERRFPSYTHVTHSLAIASFVSGKWQQGKSGEPFSLAITELSIVNRENISTLSPHTERKTRTLQHQVFYIYQSFSSPIFTRNKQHKKNVFNVNN